MYMPYRDPLEDETKRLPLFFNIFFSLLLLHQNGTFTFSKTSSPNTMKNEK